MGHSHKKIKLLVITQKVDINDDVLGFMHGWIKKLAEKLESLDVICLYKGKYDLPKNVKVYSLGKEKGKNKIKYLWHLYKYTWKLLAKDDLLFVHMNQRYIVLLWPLLKIFNKPVVLFKAHRGRQKFLKITTKISSRVVSYTKESFPFKSKKLDTIPPAIDINRFKQLTEIKRNRNKNEILFVGRISPIKNLEDVVKLALLLNKEETDFNFKIIGAPSTNRDRKYLESIKKEIEKRNLKEQFEFMGKIPNQALPKYYNESAFFINLCNKTGIDKTLLEAMACGCIPVTNQTTIKPFLGQYVNDIFVESVTEARDKILNLSKDISKREKLSKELAQLVRKNHGLDSLIDKLVGVFEKIIKSKS